MEIQAKEIRRLKVEVSVQDVIDTCLLLLKKKYTFLKDIEYIENGFVYDFDFEDHHSGKIYYKKVREATEEDIYYFNILKEIEKLKK